MDARDFDQFAKAFSVGGSRREVVRALATALTGGALLALFTGRASAQPGCRQEGHPCEGNQKCCAGLVCSPGAGGASRCTRPQRPR